MPSSLLFFERLLEALPVLGSDDGRPPAFDALPLFLSLLALEKEVTTVFLMFIA